MKSHSKNSSGNKATCLDVDINSCERFPHLDLEFLKPDKICDAEKRPLKHPDYDSKTLYIPKDFMQKQTPGKTYLFFFVFVRIYYI